MLFDVCFENFYIVKRSRIWRGHVPSLAIWSNSNLQLPSVAFVFTRPTDFLCCIVLALCIGALEGHVDCFNGVRKVIEHQTNSPVMPHAWLCDKIISKSICTCNNKCFDKTKNQSDPQPKTLEAYVYGCPCFNCVNIISNASIRCIGLQQPNWTFHLLCIMLAVWKYMIQNSAIEKFVADLTKLLLIVD